MATYLAHGPGQGAVPARHAPRPPAGRHDAHLLHLVAGELAGARRGADRRMRSKPSARGSRSRAGPGCGPPCRSSPVRRRRPAPRSSRTGSGASTAAQARTWSRFTLSVCVRGKSASGQRRQADDALVGREGRVRRLDRRVDLRRGPRPGRRRVAAAARRRRAAVDRPAGASTIASIRPGAVSSTTESRMPAVRSAFSMSSGYTFRPLGSTMMSFVRPMRIRWPPVVEPADVAGAIPAVGRERGGGRLGIVPVALEDATAPSSGSRRPARA